MRILSLAPALLLLASAPQEKLTLKWQPKAGDKMTSNRKLEMKADVTVSVGGQTQKVTQEHRETERKHVEFVDVKGNDVTKASFHVESSFIEMKPPGSDDFNRSEKPLHGQKATALLKDGKLVFEGLGEGQEEEAKKELELEDDFSKSFPPKPVAIGESWEVTGEKLKDMFDNAKLDGKLTLKLAEVKEYQGRRCAFLDASMDLKGKDEGGLDMSLKLKGSIIVWIERGYTLQAKMDGTVTMSGKTDEVEFSGEGPMKILMETTVR